MSGMPMPGGWTMSMAWMRMPGQTWPEAAGAFLGMWIVMMAAMMLPSLIPLLWRARRATARTSSVRLAGVMALVSAGYFSIWTALGAAVFPFGAALATIEMRQPALAHAVPVAVGVVVVIAGALQFTSWKARRLACCLEAPASGGMLPLNAAWAWRYGVRLGLRCSQCCGNLMLILLVVGVMDFRVMAFVTALITAERLAPSSMRVVPAAGVIVSAAGLALIARAAGLG